MPSASLVRAIQNEVSAKPTSSAALGMSIKIVIMLIGAILRKLGEFFGGNAFSVFGEDIPDGTRAAVSALQIAIDDLLNVLLGGYAVRLRPGFQSRFFF